jgi:iron complex outermembrane receptor protein
MNVVATGEFNFSDPYANDQAIWDYVAPTNLTHSTSRLWQAQGSVSRDLLQLAGGPLQAAAGLSFRKESLNNPSANPGDEYGQPGVGSSQYSRYYSINAVGAVGSRDVSSVFFEVNAPVIPDLELMASGRFDDYSSGQTNFSPKVGFKYKPIDEVAVRGTWSEGFRIPSFNEAFGLPTTGYVTATVNCATAGTYCADHGNNAYATGAYNIGLTSIGNPELDPEESTSFTFGVVLEPMDRLSFTIDYWNIQIDGLIRAATADNALINEYYATNGNPTNVPAGVVLIPGNPDPAFPAALPQLGFIVSSFTNTDTQEASGLDFGANYSLRFTDFLTWRTAAEASYLMSFEQTEVGGATYEYAGFLSPCDVTSCSGAPEWRATWQNTLETAPTQFGTTSVSLTAYYTDGYSAVTPEYVGTGATDCASGLHASVATYEDGTPVNCTQDPQWNFDLTARQTLDKYTVFLDILNVFDIEPEFDPSAAYGLFGFNPAWGAPNMMGRFFRLGVKIDFE